MIKHYGLDAAEVEHLKAANLTDEEINDLNKKRTKEQIEDEQEETENAKDFEPLPETKELMAAMPGVHPAVIGYLLSTEMVNPNLGSITEQGKKMMARIEKKGGKELLNANMSRVFFDINDPEFFDFNYPEEYNYSNQYRDHLLKTVEEYQMKGDSESEKIANDAFNIYGMLGLSESLLKEIFPTI